MFGSLRGFCGEEEGQGFRVSSWHGFKCEGRVKELSYLRLVFRAGQSWTAVWPEH